MSVHLRICVALAATFAMARTWAAEVTTEGTSSARESPRALNEHVYQPSRIIIGPFSTTSFGMATLFGVGDAEAPRFDLKGNEIGTRKYTLGAYGQALDLALRLTPDIAFRLNVEGLIFAGVNGKAILVAGATAQYGGTVGVTAGRDLSRKMRLSFVADAGSEPQLSVLVGNAVLHAVQTGTFDNTGVLSKVNRVLAAPGVSFAWAPSPVLGFITEARYLWTRRVTSDGDVEASRTSNGASVGVLASFDLDPLIRWPFALQGSYRGDFPIGGHGIAQVQQAGAGFYYSRRVRLALGLELLWRHGDIRPGVEPSLKSDAAIGSLWFRYYW